MAEYTADQINDDLLRMQEIRFETLSRKGFALWRELNEALEADHVESVAA